MISQKKKTHKKNIFFVGGKLFYHMFINDRMNIQVSLSTVNIIFKVIFTTLF